MNKPKSLREHLAQIGATGGSKSTPAKRRANKKSLAAARAKRWPANGGAK